MALTTVLRRRSRTLSEAIDDRRTRRLAAAAASERLCLRKPHSHQRGDQGDQRAESGMFLNLVSHMCLKPGEILRVCSLWTVLTVGPSWSGGCVTARALPKNPNCPCFCAVTVHLSADGDDQRCLYSGRFQSGSQLKLAMTVNGER
mgnify:CR=1 FL=1